VLERELRKLITRQAALPAIMSRRGYQDNNVMTIDDFTGRAWSLLSNHGHALICIAAQPDIRLWELAQAIGIRERSAQRIVNQLVEAGYLTRHQHDRHGARATYTVDTDRHLRRPHLGAYTVRDLLETFSRPPASAELDRERP
jgi:DNA-binding HxlR family transcriptional regulator